MRLAVVLCISTMILHIIRAANNFLDGAGQIVRSNLFLAGQTSITSYRYKSAPSPLHIMFKYETSKLRLNYQAKLRRRSSLLIQIQERDRTKHHGV